ncbi:MAG: hypothetical protein IJ749_06710 [Eubacterium sp.]|nr:hypothetical protein [Eubacterium sp.]
MHYIHPMVLKIGLPVLAVAVILLHVLKRKNKYRGGIKAANTKFVKELSIYKSRKYMYAAVSVVMEVCLITTIVASLFLVARPSKKETVNNGTKKRDIFLCMDVSYSIYELNADLVESLQDVVAGLDGDRFGVCIYNTSTVLYVPMTDDYDFVNTRLEDMKEYFRLQKEYMEKFYNPSTGYMQYQTDEYEEYMDYKEKLDYYDAGTLVNNYMKGSSLIGEGLASCMYSFPRLDDEDRTRIIIMSTDNAEEAMSKPLVELDEATDLCKKNDIKVFGIFPNRDNWSGMNTTDYDTVEREMQDCVEKTGGKFYKQSESLSVDEIIADIENEEALEVEEVTITKIVDKPTGWVIVLITSMSIMLAMGLVIRL